VKFKLTDNCGAVHLISETVNVDTGHIAVPLTIDTTVCPQTPVILTLPIVNSDLVARIVTISGSAWPVSRPVITVTAGKNDSVSITFPGGAIGTTITNVHIADDCGGNHDVTLSVTVRTHPPLVLSLQTFASAAKVSTERQVYLIATPLPSFTNGITFTIANEPTALYFDSIVSACGITSTIGLNTVSFAVNNCPLLVSDTIATLYYRTLVGSTLVPQIFLRDVSITQPCDTASGADSASINLLAPGCELGTVIVHPFTTAIQSIAPNPATGITTIAYSTIEQTTVRLEIYDALGRVVRALVNQQLSPGRYAASLDTRALASGMYYVGLRAGSFVQMSELLLMR
jgi:hypothetical protein